MSILEKRFWAKVEPMMDDRGCWEWAGSLSSGGYATFFLGRNKYDFGHRVSYRIHKGDIPQGLHIDHLCRNRSCVNPAHLEAVTQRVNNFRSDSPTTRNLQKTTCPNGHPYSHVLKNGWRHCRVCHNASCLRRYYRKREALACASV